jgi:hypothetical protein
MEKQKYSERGRENSQNKRRQKYPAVRQTCVQIPAPALGTNVFNLTFLTCKIVEIKVLISGFLGQLGKILRHMNFSACCLEFDSYSVTGNNGPRFGQESKSVITYKEALNPAQLSCQRTAGLWQETKCDIYHEK